MTIMAFLFAGFSKLFAFLTTAFSLSRLWDFFQKLITAGLFTVGLPLAIQWGLYKVIAQVKQPIFDSLGLSAQTIHLVGFGAWIADCMQVPLCFSVLMGFGAQCMIIRMTRIGGVLSRFSTDRYS